MLLNALIAVLISLVAIWLLLAITLIIKRPSREMLSAAARLPRELGAMVRTLLRDDALPRSAKFRLWVLLVYLASPVDLIPDFVPVIGYADDVIITAILLRGTARSIGTQAIEDAWPGGQANLDVVLRLCGLAGRD